MYSLDNSIREIFSDGLEKRGFYIFCPKYIVDVLSEEQKEIPLKVLKETVTMPWGAPYFSDVVVAAANLFYRLKVTGHWNLLRFGLRSKKRTGCLSLVMIRRGYAFWQGRQNLLRMMISGLQLLYAREGLIWLLTL